MPTQHIVGRKGDFMKELTFYPLARTPALVAACMYLEERGIRVSDRYEELKGTKISLDQAPLILGLLGIQIADL